MSWAEDEGYDGYDKDDFYPKESRNVWKTKDGRVMKIEEMSDSHLYYAYKKIDDERLMREMVLRLFADRI